MQTCPEHALRMKVVVFAGVALLVLCCLAMSSQAAVRTATVNPVADSGLYGATDGSDHSNRGTGGRMDIGPTQNSLVKFDIARNWRPMNASSAQRCSSTPPARATSSPSTW